MKKLTLFLAAALLAASFAACGNSGASSSTAPEPTAIPDDILNGLIMWNHFVEFFLREPRRIMQDVLWIRVDSQLQSRLRGILNTMSQ